MQKFKISPVFDFDGRLFLETLVDGYFHSEYNGGGNWKINGTIENMIWTLKNDVNTFPDRLLNSQIRLKQILVSDLIEISRELNHKVLVVCVVPRAKKESHYRADQLLFKKVIKETAENLQPFFIVGTEYIKRHTNTLTTHLKGNQGGDGERPYPGITKDTCYISPLVKGKDILLIDDIYTNSINIDEDAIQALLNFGAKSVRFYSVGFTVVKNAVLPVPPPSQSDSADDLPF